MLGAGNVARCSGDQWLPVDQPSRRPWPIQNVRNICDSERLGGDTLEDQLVLARWCRKNRLDDEARFHWASVLAHDPDNDEAQRALGIRWFHGRLMTFAEIGAAKERALSFGPQPRICSAGLPLGTVAVGRRSDSTRPGLGEFRALRDPGSIPALEDVTLDSRLATNAEFERTMQMGLALIEALDQMPGQPATNSLIRHAITARSAAFAWQPSRHSRSGRRMTTCRCSWRHSRCRSNRRSVSPPTPTAAFTTGVRCTAKGRTPIGRSRDADRRCS